MNKQKPYAAIAVQTVKTDFIHKYVPEESIIHIHARRSYEVLGLIKIQTEVKEKKFQFIWRETTHHGIFDLTLSIIPCFCGHTNKGSFTIRSCGNSRDLYMTFGCK